MTATVMLVQSCILTILGMGIVFAFLFIMILAMKLLAVFCKGAKNVTPEA